MGISSINSNLAALVAQQNISNATTAVSNNVTALSSGSRIVNAATDVSALAIGAGLQSQINSLNTALSVSSQGNSLLQVADGALAQIQTILQRQQTIASSAQSGSLNDTQRGFLDQEFQSLTAQIDQLANSTNFNGVKLINGSIKGGTSLATNTTQGSTVLPPSATIATIASNTALSGKTVTLQVSGQAAVTFTFGTSSGQVGVGATAADSAANLAAAINSSGSAGIAGFHFGSDSSGNVTAYYTGKTASVSTIPTLTTTTSNSTNVTGTGAATFSASTSIATVSGTLNVGDKITVGAHEFTLVANGDVTAGFAAGNRKIALGLSTDTGGVTGGALANLATYLNSAAGTAGFTDISGITFGTNTAATSLTAYYSGSNSTAPTISTSYTSNSPNVLVGGASQTASASSSIVTADANTFAVGSSVTVAGATFTLIQNDATAAAGQVKIGTGTLASTLTNIAAYLNTAPGQAALVGGALEGANFSSDSTHLYANNTNSTGSAYTGVTVTVSNGIIGSAGAATTLGATGGSGNSGYVTTGGGLYNTGGTNIVTFDGTNHAGNGDSITIGNLTFNIITGATSGTDIQANATDSVVLTDIAAYLNTAAGQTASGYAGVTFGVSGSSLVAFNSTDANINIGAGNYDNSTSSGITGLTVAITGTITAQGGKILTTSSAAASSFTNGSTVDIGGATITFIPNGATAGAGQVNIGANDTATLAALSAYLNSTTGQTYLSTNTSTLAGFNFTSDATKLYVGNHTGSQLTAPTITLGTGTPSGSTVALASSATLNSALGVAGFSGLIGTGDVVTVGTASNNTSSVFTTSTTATIGGAALTFVASGGTGAAINIGSNNFETLSNIATYLNSTAGQTAVDGTALEGATFSTDGTHLIATNSTASALSGATGANTITSGPTSAVGLATFSSLAAGASANVLTLGIDTVKFGDGTGGTVAVGSTLAASLQNLVTFLNSNAPTGSSAVFSTNGTQLLAQNSAGGTSVLTTTLTSATNPTFAGVTGANIAATSVVGLGAGTTAAGGLPVGNLFVSSTGTTATNHGEAVNLSGVANNASFVGEFGGSGSIGAITSTYVNTGSSTTSGVQFSVVVGDVTYTTNTITNSSLTSTTAPVALTFNGSNTTTTASEGGSFTLTLQPQTAVTSQNQADQLAEGINSGLSSVSAYQNRNVLSFNNNYSATVSGTSTATLQGSSLTFNSNEFVNPIISEVSVSSPSTGSTDAKISLVLNGETYSTAAGIGNTFGVNNTITLTNESEPNKKLILTTGNISKSGVTGSGTTIDLSSESNAAAFETALGNAVGLANASSALTFQVGSASTDTVGVSLGSAKTDDLYAGQVLDVKTQESAFTASAILEDAVNTITALRATVGALQGRFAFASNALQSTIQNSGAAKSSLLDTDVAATSTAFATAQVQLQAGIAVLAQANQLQQNLLKLIG